MTGIRLSSRKLFVLLLALILIFTFAGCKTQPAAESEESWSSQGQTSELNESPEEHISVTDASDGEQSVPDASQEDPAQSSDAGTSTEISKDTSKQNESKSEDSQPDNTSEEPRASRGKQTITFVTLNDVHGYIEQNESGQGGLSNTAYGINKLSRFYNDGDPETTVRDDLVLFANGDMLQGSAISNLVYGRSVIECMNVMQFDAMGIGNHEFDWGLDKVTQYFDRNDGNGEADFPLINVNVHNDKKGCYLADESADDNIKSSIIVEKCGVMIGLIGAIGPLKNSIVQTNVADYTFDDVTDRVKKEAKLLRQQGAELICVSIHCGDADSVQYYDANKAISLLKDDSGRYLVDVIFNGHTHTMQKGSISRPNGTDVPVVQAGGNNTGYGYARITLDTDTGKTELDGYDFLYVSNVGKQYDSAVEDVIRYYQEGNDDLEVLAVSGTRISSKYDYADYVADIMIKAFDADFSIGNYGGLRSTGGIIVGTEITSENVYEMIPFDNVIYYVTIPGKALYDFYTGVEDKYYLGQSDGVPKLKSLQNSSNLYTLAIIDYVYTGTYFEDARRAVKSEVNTNLILRDLLEEDIRTFGELGIKWTPRNGARIAKQSW